MKLYLTTVYLEFCENVIVVTPLVALLSLSLASSGAVVTWDAFDDLGNYSMMPGGWPQDLLLGTLFPRFCLEKLRVLFLRCIFVFVVPGESTVEWNQS